MTSSVQAVVKKNYSSAQHFTSYGIERKYAVDNNTKLYLKPLAGAFWFDLDPPRLDVFGEAEGVGGKLVNQTTHHCYQQLTMEASQFFIELLFLFDSLAGVFTVTVTNWSTISPANGGTPRPFNLKTLPDCVPAGIFSSTWPSIVAISTCVLKPRANDIVTSDKISWWCRVNPLAGFTRTRTYSRWRYHHRQRSPFAI